MTKALEKLNAALWAAGLPKRAVRKAKEATFEYDDPLTMLVNTGIDAAPYANILVEHAPKLKDPLDIEFVARAMSQTKGFGEAVPWLLSLFEGYPKNGLSDGHLWAVGLAIYTINNKAFYPNVIKICGTKKYGSGRAMLMGSLARAKTEKAYEVLLKAVHDPSVRAHAIGVLGRFGRTGAIPVLEKLTVKKGLYEYKAKETALRRLRRKADK